MKNLFDRPVKVILFLLFVSISSVACKGGETPEPGALDRDTSYAFGMFLAGQVGMEDLSFDYTAFMEGFRDFNEARETRLSQDQMMEKIQAVVLQMQARQNEEMASVGETNRAEGEAYLAENGAKSGITTTASGLQYEVITQGRGNKPVTTDTVRVQYEGTLIDGTVFDSSYARGTPAEFRVNQVIPGWVEGLQLMSEGSTYRFFIPGGLAYGMNPPPGSPIQPNSTLIFKVELLSIVR